MIKGCQKRIVHITNTGSPYFEEAYFILKSEGDTGISENDMIKAAMKIAREAVGASEQRTRKKTVRYAALILAGASLCSLIFGAAMLIYTLWA